MGLLSDWYNKSKSTLSKVAGLDAGTRKLTGGKASAPKPTSSTNVKSGSINDAVFSAGETAKDYEPTSGAWQGPINQPSSKNYSTGSSGQYNIYDDAIKRAEGQKDNAEDALKARKKAYEGRYDQLSDMILAKKDDAVMERDRNVGMINSELENFMTKADIGKQDLDSFYTGEKEELNSEKTNLDKELAKIFQARNITDSSYYLEKQTESNDNFLKTLEKLGGEQGRRLAEYDADIQHYQTQALSKKSEIEQAYNMTIRSITEDWTKTQWEKEDAFQQLDEEFATKMDNIDNMIMDYALQQEEFRSSVSKWSADTSYNDETWGEDFADAQGQSQADYKMALESPDRIREMLKGAANTSPDEEATVYARLRSQAKSPTNFDKTNSWMLSSGAKAVLGLSKEAENTSGLPNADELFN